MTAPAMELTPLQADLLRGFKALNAARDAYLLRWSYYAGKIPERFASERIRQLIERSADDTYRFRFARKPITVLKNRVKVAGITGKSEAVTSKLEQIRRANSMDMLEPFIHERVFTYGDCYALTYPPPDAPEDPEEADPVPADLREAGVEITYQSPLSCRAMYDAEDGLRLEYVIRRWQTTDAIGAKSWHAELWYPDGRIYPYVCRPGAAGDAIEDWSPEEREGEAWPLVHEYGMPIHHARNDLPYGRPEHADAMGPQDALTKLILTQAVVDLEAHGWPERYELVDTEAAKDTARDSVPWDDDKDAPAVTPQRRTVGKGGPGTTHILEGRKATGEYSSPNPALLTPVHDQWVRGLATVTDTPAYEYDPDRNAGLSGIARMWADKPLRDREDNAKRFLLRFYRELYGKALEIAGSPREEIEVAWARADVIMDPDWWNVATIRREHGVPQEQILLEANYDPDDIGKWLDDKDDEARSLLERITLVDKLGEALQKLGSAVALGTIDQERVDALVSRIFGESVTQEAPEPEPTPALPVAPAPPGQVPPQ